ncbi:MAG: transposase [Verrucomicrobiales bacterium]|nr:transposase [Verrucomicrobiales bacterium]
MGSSRLIGEGRSFYHCIGRCVDRGYFFQEAVVKEECRKIMRRLEKFLHVRVITYCWMSNHTHLLLEIPDRQSLEPLTEESLLELLPTLYGAVLGSASFVNHMFERERSSFGPRRQDGARRMRGANWGSLRVLRDLRKNVTA